jgi:hypothetical protein
LSTTELPSSTPQQAPRRPRAPNRSEPRQLPPTREEIVSRGEDAARLLGSASFNLAVRNALQSWQDGILFSDPADTVGREALYWKMRALNDVLLELPGFIAEAQALTATDLETEAAATAAWERFHQLDS